ncbi:MAG: hypothetical protein IKM20_00160 [Erysipelotrichales bacterium]|nr:hypothetical protein [Erysipelotrichales bacterium]
MSRIYKTNPYYEIPSTTVKIVYDDDEQEFEGEELPIEELSLETLDQTYSHTEEEKIASERNLLEKEKAEIALKQKEADEMLARAKEVLAKAQADAEIFMKNTKEEAYKLRDQIIDEGLSHVDEKQQEGFNAGFVAHEQEINQVLIGFNNILKDTITSLKAHDKEYIDSVEEGLRGLSIQIAEKVLRKQIEEDPLAMSCLTFELLDEQKKSKHINIVLSNRVKPLVEKIETELKTNPNYKDRDITVEMRDVSDDTLLIEHDSGTIDASIYAQLKKLKEFFDI